MNDKKNNAAKEIRVMLVDDHPIMREGIRSSIENKNSIRVIGEASSGREAIDLVKKAIPDVILMDITMPDMTGLEATKIILENDNTVKIIALTMHENREYIFEMLKMGANGYILKDSPPSELIKAIEEVHKGNTFLSSQVSQLVLNDYTKQIRKTNEMMKHERLTEREREVLINIANGLSNKEIAYKLHVSSRTVETHRERIMKKLDIHSIAGLTRYAISEGLIELEP